MAVNYTLSSDRELYHYLSMPEHRERAFEEIYRRYGQRIYAYCRKILFNTQDAEDAFQSTFLKFLSSVSPDREMTNLPAYLLTIARTTCMDMFAQRHEHAELVEDFHGRPDQTVEANEINELIEMALHLLPAQWREAVIMQLYANMSYEEIASAFGVPVTTVRNWLCRGRQRLREILQPYFEERHVEHPE
jgi:RNA polymerase sigma-70 factor (ECF subfamily)